MMDETTRSRLETRIHSLLCGELDEADRLELLSLVARSEEARRILGEMAGLQRRSRQAFGCEVPAAQMQESIAFIQGRLRASTGPTGRTTAAPWAPRVRRLLRSAAWSVRIVAAVVVAVSVYAAVTANRNAGDAQRQITSMQQVLLRIQRAVETPQLTEANLVEYRALWDQVRDSGSTAVPWILMQDGRGQFGYVQVSPRAADRPRVRLLRCFIMDDHSRIISKIDLLLPVEGDLNLAVPDAARIAGRPIHMDVSTTGQWTSLGLRIGKEPGGVVGLRGRARADDGLVEVGQFRLDDQKMKVFLQAIDLPPENWSKLGESLRRPWGRKETRMKAKHSPEQIVAKLRQADVGPKNSNILCRRKRWAGSVMHDKSPGGAAGAGQDYLGNHRSNSTWKIGQFHIGERTMRVCVRSRGVTSDPAQSEMVQPGRS